jgi:outer membrane usher protein
MFSFKRWWIGWIFLTFMAYPSLADVGKLRLLAITVNDNPTGVVAPVLVFEENVYLAPEVFADLRFRLPDVPAFRYQNARYYPLDAHAGTGHRIDERMQVLEISIPAKHMVRTRIRRGASAQSKFPPSGYGGFLNYDLLGEYLSDSDDYVAGGAFELGVFAGDIVGITSHVIRDATDRREHIRLDSTIVRDYPEARLTLRFGDSISRGGQWGRPVRFGGLQMATNFATQPQFVTFPTATLSGDSALPSSIDVLVNDSQRFSRDLAAGPFTIEDLPVVTGAGEVTAVVRDVLGRETVITQPYYTSPRLLRRRVHDFSFEAGFLREQFGAESYWYDDTPFFSGTYRYGYSDNLTGEAHVELAGKRQAFGVSAASPVGTYGVVSGSVAGSQHPSGPGGLLQLGFERVARDISVTAFGRLTTGRNYTDFGVDDTLRTPDAETRLRLGIPFGKAGILSTSYTFRAFDDDEDLHIVSSSYSLGVPNVGRLSLSALSTFGLSRETVVALHLTVPLGSRSSASAGLQARKGGDLLKTLEARHVAPLEGGFGGAASVSDDGFTRARGEVSYTSGYGVLSAAASHIDGENGVRLNAVGGLAVADGAVFASRRIDNSFAVVSVPGRSGVGVYSENRLVGTTDSNGRLLLHNLRAYEPNRIGIEPRDLPVDAEVGRTSATVAPRFRSGITVEFPVEASTSARLTIRLEDGSKVPPGATATLNDASEGVPVGFDGEAVLRGVSHGDRVTVDTGEALCAFTLDVEIPAQPMADLGTFTCRRGLQ